VGVGKWGNKIKMEVSLKLLLGIDLDNDYKGLERDPDGTWWLEVSLESVLQITMSLNAEHVDQNTSRPMIVGPDVPESPYPIALAGAVQKGYGRGGKDLGCPTANLPDDCISTLSSVAKTGVCYGYAQVVPLPEHAANFEREDIKVLPMVMSLGWNKFYKNERLSAEIHILHNFQSDFYGYEMRVLVLGYIRPELDYISREALIEDIEIDKQVALNCLQRQEYQKYTTDPHFVLSA